MKIRITLVVLFLICSAKAQTADAATVLELNQKVIASYQNGQLDEALKLAEKASELCLKVHGPNSLETAVALTNLGTIQREKRRFRESVQSLQRSLEIYRKTSAVPPGKIVDLLQSIAFSQVLDGKKSEAESSYLAAVNHAETSFGSQGKQNLVPILNLAQFYARQRNFEKADDFYLKSYGLALKHFGEESKEIEKIADSRVCLNTEDKRRDKLFQERYDTLFGVNRSKPEEIVNGKARNLIKPPYPQEAKNQRLTGIVKIRVKIDEHGNVSEAWSACGDGILERASLDAARMSKFSPTLLAGKPVKVSGVIIYRFTAQ
jgi:TonB family protein